VRALTQSEVVAVAGGAAPAVYVAVKVAVKLAGLGAASCSATVKKK
jgi:hypothetical protein